MDKLCKNDLPALRIDETKALLFQVSQWEDAGKELSN
jgi:hypothetical protein